MPEVQESVLEQTKKEEKLKRRRDYFVRYRAENREMLRQRSRDWVANHPGRRKAILAEYRIRSNRACERRYRQRIRREVLGHYGATCKCCGETEEKFLSLDHVNNNGSEHRRAIGRKQMGYAFYLWIKRNNYPDFLQILCHNCNMAKGFYGSCPHTKRSHDSQAAHCPPLQNQSPNR